MLEEKHGLQALLQTLEFQWFLKLTADDDGKGTNWASSISGDCHRATFSCGGAECDSGCQHHGVYK